VKINYGMGKKDPLENVYFYKKDEPDKAFQLRKSEVPVSSLLPSSFSDEFMRVYVRDGSKKSEAISAFTRWCDLSKAQTHRPIRRASSVNGYVILDRQNSKCEIPEEMVEMRETPEVI